MLPTLQRCWQFRVNLDPGRSGTNDGDAGAMFCLIKKTLVELDTPWRVVWSSNGREVSFVDDLVLDAEDVTGGSIGTPHTWVILAHAKLPGLYCFDFDHDETLFISVVWSPGGIFRGGTTTVRPGAADEILLATHAPWLGDWKGRDGIPMRAHVMATEDATRIVCATRNRVRSIMTFEVPEGPTPGWVDPSVNIVCVPYGDHAEAGTYEALWDGAPARAMGPVGPMNMALTSEGYVADSGDVAVLGRDHTLPSEHGHEIIPIGLWHDEVVGQRGHHGFLADTWWTSAVLSSGATFPDDGTKQFVVFGDMLFPWNGARVELG